MGKNINNIVLSGFELKDNNRGSAALGYGSIAFLKEKGYYSCSDKLCILDRINKRFWRSRYKRIEHVKVAGAEYPVYMIRYLPIEWKLYVKYKLYFPFTPFGKLIRNLQLVAATNGGDGLSDIYGYPIFMGRLRETQIAMVKGVNLVIMPQTIGPFHDLKMRKIADTVLEYASHIYVRDDRFVDELKSMKLKPIQERDLSAWMLPEPWEIEIIPNSIGINISGLTYFNSYRTLSGQFTNYPTLIRRIVDYFQSLGRAVYLIPHSYNYENPEPANDDLAAIKDFYNSCENKSGITIIDKDLTSPQIKYVISKMSFFIGTRMHANFAAIYTHVPVFGLAYSYKFAGAFEANGLSENQVAMITSINSEEIESIIERIKSFFCASVKQHNC